MLMTIATAVASVMVFTKSQLIISVSFSAMVLLYGFFIVYGVYRIRKVIKTINFAVPNERLIKIHFANFIVFTTLFLARNMI